MTNTNLLKSKMAAFGDDNFVTRLADLLQISRQCASDKLNSKSNFTQSEIILITKKYGLTGEEIKNIFVGVD